MRIGLFGGTYDPIHLGHLRVAEEVLEKKRLDRIIFIPAGTPPHRAKPKVAPAHRLAMVKQAVKKNDRFTVSDFEIKKTRKAYTVETLEYFSKKYRNDQLYLILGADQWLTFPSWHQGNRLLELCQIIVMSRPHIDLEQIKQVKAKLPDFKLSMQVTTLGVSKLDISSTDIRRRLHQQQSIRYLVNYDVAKYIASHQLYR